jgi:hypothetical protein
MAAIIESLDWSWTTSISTATLRSPDAILRYKIFILCKFAFKDTQPRNLMESDSYQTFLFLPTIEINSIWREHLMRPRSYSEMCSKLFGKSELLDYENVYEHSYDLHDKGTEALKRTLRYMCLVSDDLADFCVAGFVDGLGSDWMTKRKAYHENVMEAERFVSLQFKLYDMEQVYTLKNVSTKISFRDLYSAIMDLLYPVHDANVRRPASITLQVGQDHYDFASSSPNIKPWMSYDGVIVVYPIEESQLMTVFVKTMTGKTLMVQVHKYHTIAAFQVKIQEKEGIPPCMQRLTFAGKQLEVTRTINCYNLQKEATIHLILAMRGC